MSDELEMLRQLCRKQQEQIEELNGYADAVETLREIGQIIGCDHIYSPDERSTLVRCVDETIDKYRQALLPFAAAAGRPGRLNDCMTSQPLSDDAVLGLGVKVAAWRKAIELTSA